MCSRRALHFVFKVCNRKETIKFYTEVLGMKVLRHEEFEEGCLATCNGPYDGKWSKTMIGYGPEDKHFVIELTYNYGIKSYKLGNDFLGLTISSTAAIENAKNCNWPVKDENNQKCVEAPGGYKFFLVDKAVLKTEDLIQNICLSSSNLQRSIDYWSGLLGMKIYSQSKDKAVLGFANDQCKLEILDIGEPVKHEEAFGRIAFSCSTKELSTIESIVKKGGFKILTPLVSLETPGKATVHVVILADPDGHEVCFVGDEAFQELSQVDPLGEKVLHEAISVDKSDEWFAKKAF